jgi:hypothetical protein
MCRWHVVSRDPDDRVTGDRFCLGVSPLLHQGFDQTPSHEHTRFDRMTESTASAVLSCFGNLRGRRFVRKIRNPGFCVFAVNNPGEAGPVSAKMENCRWAGFLAFPGLGYGVMVEKAYFLSIKSPINWGKMVVYVRYI